MEAEFSHYGIAFRIVIHTNEMQWELMSGKQLLSSGTFCGEDLHDERWRGYLAGNPEARDALLDAARAAVFGAEA